jgi:DNA topoisomerase-3
MSTLCPPNKNLSDAVEIRQRIDLLIGASFTRLQTLCFKALFYGNANETGNKYVIRYFFSQNSYGPCQFPTLNFIVERSERIRKFVKEEFFYLELTVKKKEGNNTTEVIFNWERNRLYDQVITSTLFERVLDAKKAKIKSVKILFI